MSSANFLGDKVLSFSGVSRLAVFRLLIAFSTLDQLVFCVSTAPTMTSKEVSPGHQCWGPKLSRRM